MYNACSPICEPSCPTISFGGKLYSNGWIEGGECWNQIECFYCNSADENRCYRRVIQAPARLLNNKSCQDIPSNLEMHNSCMQANCKQEEECPDIKFSGRIYKGEKQEGSSDCLYKLKCYKCIDENCEEVTISKNQKEIRESCSDYSYENSPYYDNNLCNNSCSPPCKANPMHVVIDGVCHCAPGLEGTPEESGGQGCFCPEILDPKITGGSYVNGHCEYEITCYECKNSDHTGCSEISGNWYQGWPLNCSGYNTTNRFFYDSDQNCQQHQLSCQKDCGENEINCYGICCDLNNNYCDIDSRTCEENICPTIITGDGQEVTGTRIITSGYQNSECNYTIGCWICADGACREAQVEYKKYTGNALDIKCENNEYFGKKYYKNEQDCLDGENCEPRYECKKLYDENFNGYNGSFSSNMDCGGVIVNGEDYDKGCCSYSISCYDCNTEQPSTTNNKLGCRETKKTFKYNELNVTENTFSVVNLEGCVDKWTCKSDCSSNCDPIPPYLNTKGIWTHSVQDCYYDIENCYKCLGSGESQTCIKDNHFSMFLEEIKFPENGQDFCQINGKAKKLVVDSADGSTSNGCFYLGDQEPGNPRCSNEGAGCSDSQHRCQENCCESNEYCTNTGICKQCPSKSIGGKDYYGKFTSNDGVQMCEYTFDCYECSEKRQDGEWVQSESKIKSKTMSFNVEGIEQKNLDCGIYSETDNCDSVVALTTTCYSCMNNNNNQEVEGEEIFDCEDCSCRLSEVKLLKKNDGWVLSTDENIFWAEKPNHSSEICGKINKYTYEEDCEKICTSGGRLVNCCVRYSENDSDCYVVKEEDCNPNYFDSSIVPNFIFGNPPFVQITGLAGVDAKEHSFWSPSKCEGKCNIQGACCYLGCKDTSLLECMKEIGKTKRDENETWKKDFFKANKTCKETNNCEKLDEECGKWQCDFTGVGLGVRITGVTNIDTNEKQNRCPPGCFCDKPPNADTRPTPCKCSGSPGDTSYPGNFLPNILIDSEIFD